MSEELKLIHQVTTMSDMEGNLIAGRDRESYFLHVSGKGAVEAWRTRSPEGHEWTGTGYYGGIEVHRKNNPGEKWWGGHMRSCWVTGGECWTDGSSLAFDSVEHFFDNPSYIQSVLMDWADGRLIFGGGEQ